VSFRTRRVEGQDAQAMLAGEDWARFVDRHACAPRDVDAVPVENGISLRVAPTADEETLAVEVDPTLVHAPIIPSGAAPGV
jgi:hypothetical protein